MKKFGFFAAIVAAMLAAGMMNSCTGDSTFLGLEDSEKGVVQTPDHDPESEAWENLSHSMEFDTLACRLYTVEQKVAGDLVSYEGNEVLGKENFSKDLNLRVDFTILPKMVYVKDENLLSEVGLTSQTASELSSSEESEGNFTTTSYGKNYTFAFNASEKVSAKAMWQSLRAIEPDTTFAYAEVTNVSYNKFEAKENKKLSNADSTVFDVNLYFNIEVKCEKRSYDETFTVRVPYVRVYKGGDVPDVFETVLENKGYEAKFAVATLALETEFQEVTGELVTYRNGNEEVSREGFLKELNLEALFTQPERVYVESEEQLTAVSMTSSSHSADYVTKVEDGKFVTNSTSLDYNFKFNEGEAVKAGVNYESLAYGDEDFTYSRIHNIRFNRSDVAENANASSNELRVVTVTLYFDVEVEREDPMATRAAEDVTVYTVAVPYERALKVSDELVGKNYENLSRVIVDDQTEKISWTEVEIWSLSGEKRSEISLNLYRHFSEPALQWIYTANNQYTTTSNGSSMINETSSTNGNWTVTTRYMQYSSTANNGVDNFQNVYKYDFQKAVYSDEYYTLSFDYADWQIVEAGSSVSTTPTREVVNGTTYDVYSYVNNINTVYNISGDSYNASAKSEVKIAVLPKSLPENWGKILGAGISAVPADDEAAGDYAKKCLVIRTENGAVAVPFSMDATLPEVESVLAGYFVEGNFGEEYNSGYFTTTNNNGTYAVGKWAPAVAEYRSDEYPIIYSNNGVVTRSLSKYILAMWNWRDGNFSHVVDGYTFSASENGVLTISYNGSVVMQLR